MYKIFQGRDGVEEERSIKPHDNLILGNKQQGEEDERGVLNMYKINEY